MDAAFLPLSGLGAPPQLFFILPLNLFVVNAVVFLQDAQEEARQVICHGDKTAMHDLRIFSSGPRLCFTEIALERVK